MKYYFVRRSLHAVGDRCRASMWLWKAADEEDVSVNGSGVVGNLSYRTDQMPPSSNPVCRHAKSPLIVTNYDVGMCSRTKSTLPEEVDQEQKIFSVGLRGRPSVRLDVRSPGYQINWLPWGWAGNTSVAERQITLSDVQTVSYCQASRHVTTELYSIA